MYHKFNSLPDTGKVLSILVIFYLVGILGLSMEATKGHIELLTPYTLLMNLVLLMIYHKPWTIRHILLYSVIAITGFLVEVAGVYTGIIFGDYSYGHALGIKVMNTPLIIGINWIMLIYFVYHLTGRLKTNPFLQVIAGALLMVAYDIILEPVALRMNMWSWDGGYIPFQNYAAWFVLSVFFLSLLHIFKINASNRIVPGLFAIQAGFIFTLNIIYRII